MLDIKYIRENAEKVRQGALDKNIKFDVEMLLSLDAALKPIKTEQESLQADRNKISKEIPKASNEERPALVAKVTEIKEKLESLTAQVRETQEKIDELMLLVPQPAAEDVPVGKDDADNFELRKEGNVPNFSFKAKSHIDLGQDLNLIDFNRGTKIAGSRSYVLTGEGAMLEQAVLRFTYDTLVERGYKPMGVPVLVTEDCMVGTGYFPTGRDQAYYIEQDSLALVGTGEVPLAAYHSGEMLSDADLPIKFMAQTGCFRREAGSYGRDVKGLYRVHQFNKIEQVIISKNDEEASKQLHAELLANAEYILQKLELPYRVVYVCTGDLGQGQLRKHDIETWMPSREAYGETHSCSTFHEFQARRLKIRYKDSDGNKLYCHTLNNTAIASPRILIPLIENHQTEDGRIRIPEALRPYMGGREFIG